MGTVNTSHVPANGINGRGQARDGKVIATGRNVGPDVTNQLTAENGAVSVPNTK